MKPVDDQAAVGSPTPPAHGLRIGYLLFACMAAPSLAGGLAAIYTDAEGGGNFEGRKGFVWLYALPPAFLISVIGLVLLYMLVRRREGVVLTVTLLLVIPALCTVGFLFSLL